MAQAVASAAQPVEVITSAPHGNETLVLRLHKPKNEKKVQWDEAVVDNEHMGKKKSKCCCIYERPRGPDDDSDSDSEGERDKDCCHEHRVARAHVPKQHDPKNT